MNCILYSKCVRVFLSYSLIALLYCSMGVERYTVQAQTVDHTQKLVASPQAQALWAALHKKLSDLGKRQAEHDKLPKNSLIPFKKDQKNNAKKLKNITERLLKELQVSGLDPILKEREKIKGKLKSKSLAIIKAKEDMIGAPDKGGLFKKSRSDYQDKITTLQKEIIQGENKLKKTIDKIHLQFTKMGLRVQKRQVQDLFTVVSGKTMRTFMIRFSNLKLLSDVIAYLIQENQSTQGYANQAKRYYAIYVALISMMVEVHKDALNKIEKQHIPSLDKLKKRTELQVKNTKDLMSKPEFANKLELLKNNLQIQNKLIAASQNYRVYLENQKKQLEMSSKDLTSQFKVALNTYQTISLAQSLVGEIQKGIKDLRDLHTLTLPKMIPLSDEKLQNEFELVGGHLENKSIQGWDKK